METASPVQKGVKKASIITNTLLVLVADIWSKIMLIIQGIIVANILGPTLFGLRDAIKLLYDYGSNVHLGSLHLLVKKRQTYEYSNMSKRDYYTNLVFSLIVFVSIIFFISSVIFFFVTSYSFTTRISAVIIGLAVPVNMFYLFNNVIVNSQGKFKLYFFNNVLYGTLILVLVSLLVYLLGVAGYFLGTLLSTLIIVLINFKNQHYHFKFIFSLKAFLILLRSGFFIFLLSLNFLVFFSIDRLFVIYGFDATVLGYYSVGLFFANLIYFLIISFFIPIQPQIYQNINNKVQLIKLIIKTNNIVMCLLYFVAVLILFLNPFVIFVLPKYGPGLEYIKLLTFSILFFPVLINTFFIGKGREKQLLLLTTLFIIFGAVLNLIVILLHFDAIFISLSTLITFFGYGTTANLIGYQKILGSYKKAAKEVFNYLWPLGYALVGYGLLWLLAHFWLYGFINYYIVKIIQAILFTIWYSPILWKIEKEHRIIKMIWQGVKNKFRKEPIENINAV